MTLFWILFIYAGGLALILVEAFLPGGILGILGWLLVVTSGALGVFNYPDYGFFIILGEALGAVVVAVLAVLLLSKTGAAGLLSLKTSMSEEAGFTNQPSEITLIGQVGTVHTALRPSGTILIGKRRIDAVSNGTFIAKDAQVRVTEVHGNRVVVEAAEGEAPARQAVPPHTV
jgi:membrane-bound serine protease (ClpP class)